MKTNRFIGLLSGTSLDAIDAVLVSIDQHGHIEQLDALSTPMPDELRNNCMALFSPADNELMRYGIADREFALLCAQAVTDILQRNNLQPADITAIGSHGQTVRHHPEIGPGFTFQLGCPHTLAVTTGISVAAQFRHRDIALGGEGAPLAPLLHQHLFGSDKEQRAVINIGGIANISLMHTDGQVTGYDTGPGNGLMDAWIQHWQAQPFDADGSWAASGEVNRQLFTRMLADDYFQRSAPKSTGKERFHLQWVQQWLGDLDIPAADVQATLLELTAQTITDAIPESTASAYVCGGGAQNEQLMRRMAALKPDVQWQTTTALGVEPDWVEAVLFAWLAWRQWQGLSGNMPEVTGASRPTLPGAWYPAD